MCWNELAADYADKTDLQRALIAISAFESSRASRSIYFISVSIREIRG
jgi:hypothetical protein